MTPSKASGQTWHERAKEQGRACGEQWPAILGSELGNCTERTPPETLNRELLARIDSLEVKVKHLEQDRLERVEDRLSNAGIRERALCTRVEMLESLVQSQQWLLEALGDSVKDLENYVTGGAK